MWTTSAVAIFASRQAVTVHLTISRNRVSPQRWRIRVKLEWSGSADVKLFSAVGIA